MSVIAWDGQSIAADKQMNCNGTCMRGTKARRLASGEVVAGVGNMDQCVMLFDWYEKGADPATWPAFQTSAEWSYLVVASSAGVKFYAQHPLPLTIENPFFAWGSGRDLALGAMAYGANAKEAVLVACEYESSCGLGVDVFGLMPPPAESLSDHS